MKKMSAEEIKSKCIRNGIKIYPVPYPIISARGQRKPTCQIHIDVRGRVDVIDDIYKQDNKLYKKIDSLYLDLYNNNFNYNG